MIGFKILLVRFFFYLVLIFLFVFVLSLNDIFFYILDFVKLVYLGVIDLCLEKYELFFNFI